MKKKIVFFISSLAGGGAERTLINIINNINIDEFDVVLIIGTEKDNEYLDQVSNQTKIISLNCKRVRYCFFKLRKVILKENPSHLFTTLNDNNILLSLVKASTFKKSYIVVREASNRTQAGNVSLFNKILTWITYNFIADKIVALSKGVKEDLMSNFKIKKNKIKVIYNPVEVDKIIKLSNEQITDFHKVKDEKIIIGIGRLVEQKDFETLIRAFKLISSKVNSKLIILGKGPLESDLRTLCKNLEVESKVVFLGFKKNPYKYLKAADLFVLSSKYEGFGHVIVEAMVAGVPVISTNCKSGPSEIIQDKKNGLLVPVGNHRLLAKNAIELLQDKKLREHYSKGGFERAKSFYAEDIVKEYEELFKNEKDN